MGGRGSQDVRKGIKIERNPLKTAEKYRKNVAVVLWLWHPTPWGAPSIWKGTLMICTNSKNVSYLDCLWGELYGSINNGFLRIFAK